jgi:hypothetical protein
MLGDFVIRCGRLMSTIRIPFPSRSFEDHIQLFDDTLVGLPWASMWWRQLLLRNEDGHYYCTSYDIIDNPTEITIQWNDGEINEEITPFAAKVIDVVIHEPVPPPLRETNKVWLDHYNVYLDVLSQTVPTSSGRWYALTEPGVHIHPDDRDHVAEFWERVAALRMGHKDD